MRFRTGSSLDPSQVTDARGARRGGGLAVGGGGLGVAGIVIYLLVSLLGGGNSAGPYGNLDNQSYARGAPTPDSSLAQDCTTGADANKRQDCRIVGDINSIQKYWTGWFASKGRQYPISKTTFFTGGYDTGCGAASTDVGPFYCPADKNVYIDLGFFADLHDKFGARGGPFAEAYVLAHEYGHHTQDVLGTLDRARQGSGAEGGSVRTELQADCFAGVWAHNAVKTGYIAELTDADVADGLDAAAAVGDDRIQSETQGQVNRETWTHGSSAQRQHWFSVGFKAGAPAACDTFSGSI